LVGSAESAVRDWLTAQAAQTGLVFEPREQLAAPGDMPSETRIVVWIEPPGNLSEYLSAAPQTQFAAVTAVPLEPGANLTVVRPAAERQAFAAGFLSVLLSPDWRSAGLIPSDQPGVAAAFRNGGGYFCGDCAPGWPLGANFPLLSGAPASADGGTWAAEVEALFENGKAEVFYLSAAAYRPEVYAALANRVQIARTVVILGSLPPPTELRAQWALTVGFDLLPSLQQALPEMLAGRSAGAVEAALALSDVNPDLLSPGRLELFNIMRAELERGKILTGSVE
jgi:hypothetical protein